MAKLSFVIRHLLAAALAAAAFCTAAATPIAAPAAEPRWTKAARTASRLQAADLGLVINTADPYSRAVGEHYVQRRGLRPEQVLRIELPLRERLTRAEFELLRDAVERHFGPATQALALAWTLPYAVECQSVTGALALGFSPGLCQHSCAPSVTSPFFNAGGTPRQHGLRLAMQLAAPDVAAARAMIDRGVASDGRLGLRGAPPVQALFGVTADKPRNVRAPLYPPPGPLRRWGVEVRVEAAEELHDRDRVLLLHTGGARVPHLRSLRWVDGAVADHVTSFGGVLDGSAGQTTALEWIAAGATASYGTASEPCAHAQKFPQPQLLLLHYLQGSTAIEAYWRSVAWPLQGVFIGEPLAAPFARR